MPFCSILPPTPATGGVCRRDLDHNQTSLSAHSPSPIAHRPSPSSIMASAAQPRPTPAWALDFPEPKATPPKISQEELAELVRTKSAGVDYLVVDVRRSDIEVSLPAASKSASAADHRIPHPSSHILHSAPHTRSHAR